jgi:hypothetical protein
MHVRLLTFNRRDLACQVRKSQGHIGRHHSRAHRPTNPNKLFFFGNLNPSPSFSSFFLKKKEKGKRQFQVHEATREQLQQFGKPTWHPYNFGKTRKIGLQ